MSYSDLVSVIIPVFNRDTLIHESIQSVLDQTYTPIELIVVDDGSTDSTLKSLEKYKDLSNVSIISIKHSGYVGFVRNEAVKFASGEWIAFLDSDDIWENRKIEMQMQVLKSNPQYRFIHTLERWIRNDKVVSQKHRKHEKAGDLFQTSLGKCEIGPSTVLMEKSLFYENGGFREDLEICEDYEFWLKITSKNPVAYLDEPLVIKRGGHEDQLSLKYGFIEIFKIDALKKLVDENFFSGDRMILARKELARKCRIYSRGCFKRNKNKEGEKYESLYFFYSIDDVESEE